MTQEEKAKKYDEDLEKARKRVMTEPQDHTDAILKDIFPELRESEDEKIRKWIFDLINNMSFENLTASERTKNEEWRKKVLTYLDRQKENPEEPKIAFGDWGDKEKKESIFNCLKYMRFIKKITNQEYDDLTKWLDSNLVYNLEIPAGDITQAEWSEEDEDFINILILHFNYLIDKGGDSVETYKSYIKKLKSLRPSWKPSEEQIYSLGTVVKGSGDCIVGSIGYNLKELYEQLKKL